MQAMILPSLLFKFGELADLQALLHRGLIYMNSWAFFKDCERYGDFAASSWKKGSYAAVLRTGAHHGSYFSS